MNDPKSGDSPDRLREEAERCFRLANGTTDERAHDALVAYGHELLEKARALLSGDCNKDQAGSIGMTVYRLCLLGVNATIAAVQRFSVATDEEALSVARVLVKGRPQLSGFELWEGGRKVGAESYKRER
jgi:hypothetical protein